MKEICLGTIGSGSIVHHILDNVQKLDGIRLCAVYSRTIERAKELGEAYGCTELYTNLDQLLSNETVNTIYIASPNLLHYEQARKALEAGKHVWCEKPFTTDPEKAFELIRLAEEKGLYLVETAPTTFLPNYRLLKRALQQIGRVRLVMGSYSQYSARYDMLKRGELPNIFNPELAGGCLMDINFYNIHLCCALFGRPDRAFYYPNRFPGVECDTSGIAVLEYPDFKAVCSGAKDTWGDNAFQIQGEDGYITVRDGASCLSEIKLATREDNQTKSHQPETDRWFYEVQELTRMFLEDDAEAIASRHQIILDTVAVMTELRQSAGIRFPGEA